jgi:hypothetical protein
MLLDARPSTALRTCFRGHDGAKAIEFFYEFLGLDTSCSVSRCWYFIRRIVSAKDLAWPSCNRASECLAQRRQGRKGDGEGSETDFSREFTLSFAEGVEMTTIPNLACFAPWRESITLFDNFRFVLANHKYFHLRVTALV